jgi:hypothetical protein
VALWYQNGSEGALVKIPSKKLNNFGNFQKISFEATNFQLLVIASN